MNPVLERARIEADMSLFDLWVGYLSLGGMAAMGEVEIMLTGAATVSAYDHDLLTQALNDSFTERGLDHPVAYFGHPPG